MVESIIYHFFSTYCVTAVDIDTHRGNLHLQVATQKYWAWQWMECQKGHTVFLTFISFPYRHHLNSLHSLIYCYNFLIIVNLFPCHIVFPYLVSRVPIPVFSKYLLWNPRPFSYKVQRFPPVLSIIFGYNLSGTILFMFLWKSQNEVKATSLKATLLEFHH